MSTPQKKRGLAELRDARRESRALYWTGVPKHWWADWSGWTFAPLPLALFMD